MKKTILIVSCVSFISCKPRDFNSAETLAAAGQPVGRGSEVKANVGSYLTPAGHVVNVLADKTPEGLQIFEAHNKDAIQSKSRFAVNWTSKDSQKLTGIVFVIEGRGLRECGQVFFMLQGTPALRTKGTCDLQLNYTALGATADSYYTTGETLNVTDYYENGQQFFEFFRNSAQQSKTKLKVSWLNIDKDGNTQGKVFELSGRSCGSVIFANKNTIAFDAKNPCKLSKFYTRRTTINRK
ncbi:MAG: hypothetical protein RL189_2668 [Pseudomonadota bacterium]